MPQEQHIGLDGLPLWLAEAARTMRHSFMTPFAAFDVGTLLLTVAITALVATGLLVLSALQHGREVHGLPYWVAGGVLLSTAGPLFMMQHEGLTFVSIFLPNTFSHVGLFLIGVGFSRSLGRIGWGVIATLVATSTVFLSFVVTGWPGIEGRLVASAIGIIAASSYIMWSLPPEFSGTLVGRSIVGAASLLIISSAMQVLHLLFMADIGAAALVQLGSVDAVFVVVKMVATITLLFALVLVVPHELAMQKDALSERIKKGSEAKSRFLTGVAHDLRSPLTMISALGEVLAARLQGEEQKYVQGIRMGADEIDRMARSLTELAQLQEGSIKLDRQPIAVGKLLHESVAAERVAAEKAGIEIVTQAPAPTHGSRLADAPELTAMADEESLRRVVRNLVGNARAYCRRGDVVTLAACRSRLPVSGEFSPGSDRSVRRARSVERRPDADEKAPSTTAEAILITISDTGPGIDPEFMDDLFEPFVRNAPETEGAGLGLAITKELVEAMGGTIGVQSRPGEGARFEIRLQHTCASPQPGHHAARRNGSSRED